MNVRQHIPDFCEGFDRVELTVSTLEELLNVEFVKRWPVAPEFHQFSQSPRNHDTLLMAEFKDGKQWWVVAYLSGSDMPEMISALPKWGGRP